MYRWCIVDVPLIYLKCIGSVFGVSSLHHQRIVSCSWYMPTLYGRGTSMDHRCITHYMYYIYNGLPYAYHHATTYAYHLRAGCTAGVDTPPERRRDAVGRASSPPRDGSTAGCVPRLEALSMWESYFIPSTALAGKVQSPSQCGDH